MYIADICNDCEMEDCDGCITYERWKEDGTLSDNFEDNQEKNNSDQLIYVSSAQEKYSQMFKEFKKHPYKLVEYYSGVKLSLWQRIYFDTIGKLKKSDYEKQQINMNKILNKYITR